MHQRCRRPLARMRINSFLRIPASALATSWVHYTTSCKHRLVLLRMGEIIARNTLSWLELLKNRYFCIWLVVYITVSVMHGQTNIKFTPILLCRCRGIYVLRAEPCLKVPFLNVLLGVCVCVEHVAVLPGGGEGARLSAPIQTRSGAHPSSCTMYTGSFPGIKRPGRGFDHIPHRAPKLKKE